MKQKMKRILKSLFFLMAVPLVILAFVFANTLQTKTNCEDIVVHLRNSEVGFVTSEEIKESLIHAGVSPKMSKLNSLDTRSLELEILENPWVAEADIFIAANDKLNVQILQRQAQVRLQRIDSVAKACYLDALGNQMPLSVHYSPSVPVITVRGPLTQLESKKDILAIANHISKDSFWNAAITQIHYNKNGEFELSSEIGTAGILFGSIDNMSDKFNRLLAFYQKGVSRINWGNVRELDLRFDRQLICRRYHEETKLEESRTPGMYAKRIVKPIQKKVKPKQLASKSRALSATKNKVVVQKKKIAKKSTPKKKLVAQKKKAVKKKSESKKKTATPKVVKKTKSKVKPKKKQKVVATETPKPKEKPKAKQIIIPSEPISKN